MNKLSWKNVLFVRLPSSCLLFLLPDKTYDNTRIESFPLNRIKIFSTQWLREMRFSIKHHTEKRQLDHGGKVQTTSRGENNFAFPDLMHACGRNIDFVFFIFHSSFCISRRFDDQSRNFFEIILCHFVYHFLAHG